MMFCPYNCTNNTDPNTHEDAHPLYEKSWSPYGYTQPTYSKQSQQEIDAGFSQGAPGFVHAGEPTLCKKPYPVCDYPNGDIFVRDSLQKVLRKSQSGQCQASMKIFLCALYRRKCTDRRDLDVNSPTYGRTGVFPVCWDQCYNGYIDCGFNKQYAILMCGEYIKAGWVTYQYREECDSPAGRLTPSPTTPLLLLLLGLALRSLRGD